MSLSAGREDGRQMQGQYNVTGIGFCICDIWDGPRRRWGRNKFSTNQKPQVDHPISDVKRGVSTPEDLFWQGHASEFRLLSATIAGHEPEHNKQGLYRRGERPVIE